jgi:aminoglycoside phosphotransferase
VTLAFDPAVPHRDALLDGHGLGVGAVARVYAKYRVGESLRVVHRLSGGGHSSVRSYPAEASEDAYRRALAGLDGRRNGGAPARSPVVHVPELDAVVWTFPADRKLAALPLLAGPSGALDRLVGRVGVTPRLVAYCAERSATAQCLDAAGRVVAFAKVQVGDGAERERRRLERVAAEIGTDDPHLRVPRVVGATGGALAVEAVEGRRLDTLGGALAAGLERLGAALATLHERSSVPTRRFERLDGERLRNAARVIGRARPDAAAAAAALLDALLERREDADGPAVCLHGDPGLRNAILDGGRVALIDFEDAAAGPAAADLGRVLAGLPPAAADPLVRGYAGVRRPPTAPAIRWHTAASVLARWALPAVSRVRPDALQRLRAVLEEARPPGSNGPRPRASNAPHPPASKGPRG